MNLVGLKKDNSCQSVADISNFKLSSACHYKAVIKPSDCSIQNLQLVDISNLSLFKQTLL